MINSEDHVLGIWLGGGVTPAALRIIEIAMRQAAKVYGEAGVAKPAVVTELENIANACHAQLSKLPDPARYL